MLSKLKKFLKRIMGEKNYRLFVTTIYRVLDNIHFKYKFCKGIENWKQVKSENKNVYFGYYDRPANKNNKVLFIEINNKKDKIAQIGYYDLLKKEKQYIANTKAFNTQMGSRMTWLTEDSIIYNDYENKRFVSKMLNIKHNDIQTYDFPIYDISSDKKYSFYTNFSILNFFRPGYGYSNIEFDKNHYDIIKNNGIYRGEFKTNTTKVILSMEDILKFNGKDKATNTYINHICVSPFSEDIMFFHLWEDEKGELKNRVIICDYDGKIKNVLDDFDRASHYTFKNENELLLTIITNGVVEYRLYDLKSNKYKVFDFLAIDGHPSYISSDIFITDTYPDHNGMQHLIICNEKGILCEIAQMYHNPRMFDEFRNDLHPRYSNGILTFDSLIGKFREENIIQIDLEDEKLWKNKEAEKSEKFEYSLYKYLYKNLETSRVKIIYSKIFDFSFKAHILLNKMLTSKNKFKQQKYFNKLQKIYSVWISPKCKIGKNFHMMHLDGICIGSGAVIGDNCTVYQQVTIGKEKNEFPTIGNNVTIYAGAKIIGGVKIGDNAIIGANAVVLHDVPDNCTAVGIPARIIKG